MSISYEKLVKEDLQLGYGTLAVTMPGGGTATGHKVGLHTFADSLHISSFGGAADGSDTTPALNAALVVAATIWSAGAGGSVSIQFGTGNYRFASKPNRIGTGVTLRGNGSVGSTGGYGTRLICDYAIASATEGFLEWDGSGPANGGTGGGIRDCQVYRAAGFSGGVALKFSGSADTHRAGFNRIEHVIIATLGSAMWDYGVLIDGTGLNTSGTQGVRTTYMEGIDIASCNVAVIKGINAIHVKCTIGHFFPGTAANALITFVQDGNPNGESTNVFFASCNIDGDVTLDGCNDFVYCGRIGGNFSTTSSSDNISVFGSIHGTKTVNTLTCTLCLDDGLWLARPLYPTIAGSVSAQDSGIFTQPSDTSGWDLFRARALSGATGTPLGFSCTPVSGGSAQPYFAYNQNQNAGDNDATYFRTSYPSFRLGNPLGNGTYPWWIYVAPAGVAGAAITWVNAMKIHGTTGVVECPAGLAAGDVSGLAFAFTVLTNTSTVDPGSISDGAVANVNLTVTGAALGDTCLVSFTGISTSLWILSALVTSAGNTKVTFLNKTGGAVDLPSGTLRVDVIHHL